MKGLLLRTSPPSTGYDTLSYPVLAAILQRVLSASVTVEKELVSSIGKGILVFAAVAPGDTEKEVESLATKVLKLRLWDDDSGGRVSCPLCPPFWLRCEA